MAAKFDLNEQGHIKNFPLTGFLTAIAAGMACLLRVEYAASPEALSAGKAEALQLVLTAQQARELATALSQMADAAEGQDQSAVRQ